MKTITRAMLAFLIALAAVLAVTPATAAAGPDDTAECTAYRSGTECHVHTCINGTNDCLDYTICIEHYPSSTTTAGPCPSHSAVFEPGIAIALRAPAELAVKS